MSVIAFAIATAIVSASAQRAVQRIDGAIVRGSTEFRQLALVFTGHEYAESAPAILDELARRGVRASFFVTGAFLRDPARADVIRRIVKDGHYIGPHSDAHLLYAPWTGPKKTLVTRAEFTADLEKNLDALMRFGVTRSAVPYFLPPYEWYTAEIAQWTERLGLTLICHTPGTRSNADYTEEGTPQFVSTDAIFESILRREREDPHGLNGFMLLLHAGAGPRRQDKFHRRFGELLDALATRGYWFVRVDRLLSEGRKDGMSRRNDLDPGMVRGFTVGVGQGRAPLMHIFTLVALAVGLVSAQAPQHLHDVNARGAKVMGFDQEKTAHHFHLYTDGGAIDVGVRDAADAKNRDAIRAHLPHIAAMFGQGDFEAPMLVHAKKVPGTEQMAALKDRITFTYVETPLGGRVDIVTRDRGALAAVHEFLRFQIADHATGDGTGVKTRK